ncbi:hypothetical protein [Thermococcus sp. 9N3]|uniref:hypothetical protein n=1 Tax=Thermococcus sp. 9N3 TaxID=163002 RepID=UPI0016B01682|nr:hypothetical protein [Thermococcus sp. 9N3]NJE49037.1 hypothetical protein [Thermococcus sp. 9N3]
MDFALFMERYGYKVLLVVLVGGVFAFILGALGYSLHMLGRYSWDEAGFFVGLLVVASLIGAYTGRFMNTATTLFGRIGYHYWAKLFEDKKKLEKEKEKLREEGGKLY